MRDEPSNVIRVTFPRKPRPKRKGLALSFGATSDGRVIVVASGRRYFTVKQLNSLIRDLRDVRDDAKARVKRG